jgi:hypothetical protein
LSRGGRGCGSITLVRLPSAPLGAAARAGVVLAVMAALLPATVAAAAEGDLVWAETFGGTGSDYWYDPGLTRTRGRAAAARRGSSGRR